MVMLKEGKWGKTGIDVLDWHEMNRVKPEGYIVAHMLGIASRAQRRRMYFCMLKQAIWAGNDDLAHFAIRKCILFLSKKTETVHESDYWAKGPHPTLWSSEKEAEQTVLQHRLLKFYQALLQNPGLYKRTPGERMFERDTIKISLSKTWEVVLRAVTELLHDYSRVDPTWKLPVDEVLVDKAYNLLHDIYTDATTRKAFGFTPRSYDANFPSPGKDVIEVLRNTVNRMDLTQTVFFLEKYPQMPKDWLHLFRVEFVRKGGAINLKGEPLKN